MASLQAGRWEEGIPRLRSVLAREPGFAEVWSNLAYALRALGRLAEAREALERAVSLKPGLADAWNLLGLVEQEAHRHDAALAHFDRALALRPDFAIAWMNRANSEQALRRFDASAASYARALQVAPGFAGIHYNLGHLHHKGIGRFDEAARHYAEAIRLDPGFANAHLNLGHMHLAQGRLAEGWREFAWRIQRRDHVAAAERAGRPYTLPQELPPALRLRAEQGLGDILFFLRYAGLAADRGTRVSFSGEPRLASLLARSGVFTPGAPGGSEEILVGDLPLFFPADIPRPFALAPDAAARSHVEARLQAAGPRPWIALTYRAGERGTGLFDRLYKEVPVARLGEALRGKPGTCISVQRAPEPAEHEALQQALGAVVHDFSDVNADLEDALALMDLADQYVSVSNTNIHLRAGLKRGAHVLVPFPPEWRWGLEGESAWFPDMKTYRQESGGDWSRALAELGRAIGSR